MSGRSSSRVAFFRSSIPDELYEAAQLDGASDLRFLWTVVLPLSKPLLAVIALMYAIYQWNSYFDALLYLRDPSLYPLQLVLRNVLILNQTAPGLDAAAALERQQLADLLKYSLIVISTVPVMLVYPFVARFFNKGILDRRRQGMTRRTSHRVSVSRTHVVPITERQDLVNDNTCPTRCDAAVAQSQPSRQWRL